MSTVLSVPGLGLAAMGDAALVLTATVFAVAVAGLALGLRRWPWGDWLLVPLALITGAAAAAAVVHSPLAVGLVVGVYTVVAAVGLRRYRGLHPGGLLLLMSQGALYVAGLAWFGHFVLTAPVSTVTRALLLVPLPVGLATLAPVLVRTFENLEPLVRRQWTRPREPQPRTWDAATCPRVSIHVPAHAEPPDLVIATLDALAGLDYPDFEVLVIDNNTSNPDLWRPVQAHCAHLGDRFRFHHIEGITGAKAGALNYALDHTDPSATLIAVIDADYQVTAGFLADTVGFFDDEAMGFVQTPHAYRDWHDSLFLRMCNWEYASFFATGMVSLNERNAGITVGTMCLIRRDAIELAGRWATWCLTEDSELAVRIHAAGYSSVYLRQVYGRGLIPDTFAGYRKQRFRWTYGPVSELARHHRLYLPRPWRQASALTRAQRVHHATHGLYGITTGLSLLALPLGALTAASMIEHHERLALPFPLWLAVTLLLVAGTAIRWITYRTLLGARPRDWLAAMLATAALAHVVLVANLTAMLGRPVPWQRTDKFRRPGRGLGALAETRTENLLALTCLTTSALILTLHAAHGLIAMLAVGFALRGLQYGAAPLVTLIAEYALHHDIDHGAGNDPGNTTGDLARQAGDTTREIQA
jgi:cellulose synthase/poly-beta-1,6-N-acetylglucosamine synthase-like glycosyltransferase